MEELETRITVCQRLDFFLFCKMPRLAVEAIGLLIQWTLMALSSGAKCTGQEDNNSSQLEQRVTRFCCLDVHRGHLVHSISMLHKTEKKSVSWMASHIFYSLCDVVKHWYTECRQMNVNRRNWSCKQSQIGAQFFLVYLSISTCFGRLCAHHQEKWLYLCDICYLSLCEDERLQEKLYIKLALITRLYKNIKTKQNKTKQNKTKQNKTKQNKSNRIKSNQIKSNQIKSNQIKSNQIKSNKIK